MKKHIFLAFCAVTMLLLATSCEREGVYSPKKRISKIYVDDGSGRKLDQAWTWKGKQLESITFTDNKILDFRYNKKNQLDSILVRLWRATINYDDYSQTYDFSDDYLEYYVLSYDGSGKHIETLDHYKTFEDFNSSSIVCIEHYEFEYNTDGLISAYHLKIKNRYDHFLKEHPNDQVLCLLFPEMPRNVCVSQLSRDADKDSFIIKYDFMINYYDVSFLYSGGNVVHSVVRCAIPEGNRFSYDYTYTPYRNPFFRMFQNGTPKALSLYSQNLVNTSCIVDSMVPEMYVKELCSWEYDLEKEFPVRATCSTKIVFDNTDAMGNSASLSDTMYYSTTYYYEYY